MVEKPRTVEEYAHWLVALRSVNRTALTEAYYGAVIRKIKNDIEAGPLWTSIPDRLREFDQEYKVATGYDLLAYGPTLTLYTKPLRSFLLKTFRKDILNNTNWPQPPLGDWLVPPEWFTTINDVVRTTLVVKYLDGIEFIAAKLQALCQELNLTQRIDFEAREEGYYAAHFYVYLPLHIPKVDWDTKQLDIQLEIQITTQVKDVIKRLTHAYYEQRRVRETPPLEKWQWDYQTDEFIANYLGHILHYVEGMIMDVRERQKRAARQ